MSDRLVLGLKKGMPLKWNSAEKNPIEDMEKIKLFDRINKLKDAMKKAISICNSDMKEDILQEAIKEDEKCL